MKVIAALPVLIAFLVGALPAHAWTWPVSGPVLQPFNFGDDPFAAGQHRGLDIAASPGTTVVAPAGGVVTFAGSIPRSGRAVTIATGDGYSVTLVHLGSYTVARGATIAEGAPVGTIGPSGEPEHPQGYVHLGIRVTANEHGYLDPVSFLPAAPVDTGSGGVPEVPGESEGPAEIPEPHGEGEQPELRDGEEAPTAPGEEVPGERPSPADVEAGHPEPTKTRTEPGSRDGADANVRLVSRTQADRASGPAGTWSEQASDVGPATIQSTSADRGAGGTSGDSRPEAVPTSAAGHPPGAETGPDGPAGAAPASVGRRHERLGAGVGAGVAAGAVALLGLVAMLSGRMRRRGSAAAASAVDGGRDVGATTPTGLREERVSPLDVELEAWLEGVLGPKSACAMPCTRPRGRAAPTWAGPTRSRSVRAQAGRYARAG